MEYSDISTQLLKLPVLKSGILSPKCSEIDTDRTSRQEWLISAAGFNGSAWASDGLKRNLKIDSLLLDSLLIGPLIVSSPPLLSFRCGGENPILTVQRSSSDHQIRRGKLTAWFLLSCWLVRLPSSRYCAINNGCDRAEYECLILPLMLNVRLAMFSLCYCHYRNGDGLIWRLCVAKPKSKVSRKNWQPASISHIDWSTSHDFAASTFSGMAAGNGSDIKSYPTSIEKENWEPPALSSLDWSTCYLLAYLRLWADDGSDRCYAIPPKSKRKTESLLPSLILLGPFAWRITAHILTSSRAENSSFCTADRSTCHVSATLHSEMVGNPL